MKKMSSAREIHYPPINQEVGRFLVVGTPTSPNLTKQLKQTVKQVHLLKEIRQNFTNLRDKYESLKLETDEIDAKNERGALLQNHEYYIPTKEIVIIIFLKAKLRHLKLKRNERRKGLVSFISEEISSLIMLGESFISQKVPVKIDLDGLKKYYAEMANNDPFSIQYKRRIKIIIHKIETNTKNLEKFEITSSILLKSLELCQENCLDNIMFTPSSIFDDTLASFVPSKIVNGIAKRLTESDFEPFDAYFHSLCEILSLHKNSNRNKFDGIEVNLGRIGKKKKEAKENFRQDKENSRKNAKITLRNSLSRLMFNKFFELSPILDITSNELQSNIEFLDRISPCEMRMNKDIALGVFARRDDDRQSNEGDCRAEKGENIQNKNHNPIENQNYNQNKKENANPNQNQTEIENLNLNNGNNEIQSQKLNISKNKIRIKNIKIDANESNSTDVDFSNQSNLIQSDSLEGGNDTSFSIVGNKNINTDNGENCESIATINIFNVPFSTIFSRDKENFAGIFSLFESIQFLTDPYDIVERIWRITMIIKDLICKALNSPNFDFDDYFSTFVSLFCGNAPINAKGVALFLRLCSPLPLSDAFAHASATFIGAVEYVEHFENDNGLSSELKEKYAEFKRDEVK